MRPATTATRSTLALVAGVLAAVALLTVSAGTAAATPSGERDAACWQRLLTDWYDGAIDGVYPLPCYHEAIKHIPATLQVYSSAKDDILNAEAAAAAGRAPSSAGSKTPHTASGGSTSTPAGGGGLPTPLLALGGLALLFLVAGLAGTVWRRRRGRPGSV